MSNLQNLISNFPCVENCNLFYCSTSYFCNKKIKTRNSNGLEEILVACGAVLCLFSASIRRIIEKSKRESMFIELYEFDTEVIKSLLNWMYQRKVRNFNEELIDLMQAAERYEIDDLKEFCLTRVQATLTTKNVLRALTVVNSLTGFNFQRASIFLDCLKLIAE